MEKVVVTGGAGFIGSHIVDGLVEKGFEVVVLDNLFSGKKELIQHNLDKIEFIEGDIRDVNAVEKALKGADFVLHQAARKSVPVSLKEPLEFNDVNVNGTLRLLEAARKFDIKRFVFASSSSVYGDVKKEDLPQKETLPLNPKSPYALTKVTGEQYMKAYSKLYGLGTISLRYFNVFGPRQDPNSEYSAVIPLFIKALMNDRKPRIFGDGEQSRDFTYVKNIVEANIQAMKSKKGCGDVFNTANGKPMTINRLAESIGRILEKDIKPEHAAPRPGDIMHSFADNTKAKEILGYKEVVSFNKGLKLTVDWFKKVF